MLSARRGYSLPEGVILRGRGWLRSRQTPQWKALPAAAPGKSKRNRPLAPPTSWPDPRLSSSAAGKRGGSKPAQTPQGKASKRNRFRRTIPSLLSCPLRTEGGLFFGGKTGFGFHPRRPLLGSLSPAPPFFISDLSGRRGAGRTEVAPHSLPGRGDTGSGRCEGGGRVRWYPGSREKSPEESR